GASGGRESKLTRKQLTREARCCHRGSSAASDVTWPWQCVCVCVCVRVCACVCMNETMCVCVCVCERERLRLRLCTMHTYVVTPVKRYALCVCVCVGREALVCSSKPKSA